MTDQSAKILARLRLEARALGFDALGVADAETAPDLSAHLKFWLESGAAGQMHWMAQTAQRRAHPQKLWPQARSVVMAALNYGPSEDPRKIFAQPELGAISVYARGRDYHDVLKGKLKNLAGKLVKFSRDYGAAAQVKIFVDTAPVMEKPLAQQAGLGWQGKHTNLVSRGFGSWLFLGAIFTDLVLPADAPAPDRCGQCRACLDACPTQAFFAPYRLDARKCISYLTIEHKGAIALEFRDAIGNRIYGCDDCLAACPWNKFAQIAREAKFIARDNLAAPPLQEFLQMDDAKFREKFSASPIKRIGYVAFMRNVLIGAGNSGQIPLKSFVENFVRHDDPVLRETAQWALQKLGALQKLDGALKN